MGQDEKKNTGFCQAIIESVFLLKDGSVVAGCNVTAGTVRAGDSLFYVDSVGRTCFSVKIGGIVLPKKGNVESVSAGEENSNRAALRIMDHKATELHIGHTLQSEVEEGCYESAPGWDAITERFEKLYPGQRHPAHYGAYASFKPGERGPLDGISVYAGKEYFHFVTYGLSELYEKQNGNPNRSGYGFELTCKLKREGLENPALEVRHLCSLLQMAANLTEEGGHQFLPGQFLAAGLPRGIDAGGKSALFGFVTRMDEAGIIRTAFGNVAFIQLVGITSGELEALKGKRTTVQEVLERVPNGLTDYQRK